MTITPQSGHDPEPETQHVPPAWQASDPHGLLLNAPMSRFQVTAIAVIAALCGLDGFDVLAMTFAAPALLAEWGIDKAQLGYALSAGLLGMALGSLLLSPWADILGRRRMLFISLALMIGGTLWTATSGGVTPLIASRLITGLGIGGMIGIVPPLATEYANARRRDLAVSVSLTVFGIGASVGGLVSAWLLAAFGWRSIFWLASGLGLVMAILVWRFVLDPISLILVRPGRDGLARANLFLRRCGHPPLASLPVSAACARASFADLSNDGIGREVLILTAIYFVYMVPQFYLQTWLPTLVTDIGLSPSRAALVSSGLASGGVAGGLFVAATSLRIGLKRLELILMTVGAVLMILFSLIPASFPMLIAGAALTGFFVQGGMVALYAIIARTFPAHLRASATGIVVGIGRLGSILPPLLAGLLFAAGTGRFTVTLLMAAPTLVALALLWPLRVRPPTMM